MARQVIEYNRLILTWGFSNTGYSNFRAIPY